MFPLLLSAAASHLVRRARRSLAVTFPDTKRSRLVSSSSQESHCTDIRDFVFVPIPQSIT